MPRHAFPGLYMFKVIGKADDAFVARVVAAVRAELGGAEDPPYTVRATQRALIHLSFAKSTRVRASSSVKFRNPSSIASLNHWSLSSGSA